MQFPSAWAEHDRSVKPYLWSQRAVGWTQSLLGLAFMALLIFRGYGHEISQLVQQKYGDAYLSWLVYFGSLAGFWKVVTFPFSITHYRIEKHFGLSKQTFLSWLADQGKGIGLGAILGAVALGLIYASVRYFPSFWWVVCATLLIFFSIVLAQLTPVIFIPLFFKLKPMEGGTLKTRLLTLCEKFSIDVKDVFHLGLGEKTEKGNAAFLGLGRTKMIVIGDTLYEKFPQDEVEAVFAHELGHQVHNDLWKGIGLSAIILYVSFGLADLLLKRIGHSPSPESPFEMLLFFVVLSLVQIPFNVFQAAYSRAREWAADGFADVKIGKSSPLAAALERLTYQNRGQFKPNGLLEFIGHSHPAPWRRITALRK